MLVTDDLSGYFSNRMYIHTHTTFHYIGINRTSSLAQVASQNYKELSDILEADFNTSGLSSLQKLKTLYNSCMDTATIDSRGVQPLRDLIASTGEAVRLPLCRQCTYCKIALSHDAYDTIVSILVLTCP